MSDIDDFIKEKNAQPKQNRSKLEAFKDEIFQLKAMGFSEKVIVEFLAEKKNLKVAQQTLNQFIRSRSAQMQIHYTIAQNSVSNTTQPSQFIQAAEQSLPAENQPVRRGLRKPTPTKKFNWEEKADPESLK